MIVSTHKSHLCRATAWKNHKNLLKMTLDKNSSSKEHLKRFDRSTTWCNARERHKARHKISCVIRHFSGSRGSLLFAQISYSKDNLRWIYLHTFRLTCFDLLKCCFGTVWMHSKCAMNELCKFIAWRTFTLWESKPKAGGKLPLPLGESSVFFLRIAVAGGKPPALGLHLQVCWFIVLKIWLASYF